jgi:hypothetical protein
MPDLLLALLFVVAWLGFLAVGCLLIVNPMAFFKVVAEIMFIPYRRNMLELPPSRDPLFDILYRKGHLEDATIEEVEAWQRRARVARGMGLALAALCIGLVAITVVAGTLD